MIKYDINRPIYFKLSESGKEALDRYYGNHKSTFLTNTKEINGEVYYEASLWEFLRFSVNLWILDIIFLLKVVFILKKYFK